MPTSNDDGGDGSLFESRPLYVRVRDELARRIAVKSYAIGSLLPNEFILSNELGVSVGTIRKAVEMLVAERLVIRGQGRGTVIADRNSTDFRGRFDRVRASDGSPIPWAYRELSVEVRDAGQDEREALNFQAGGPVISIRRIREYAGRPIKREYCRLPADIFAPLDQVAIEETTIERLAYSRGIMIGESDEWLSMIPAPLVVARDFGVDPGKIVMRLERLVYDDQRRPIEWRIAHCDLGPNFYSAPSPFGSPSARSTASRPHRARAPGFVRHIGSNAA